MTMGCRKPCGCRNRYWRGCGVLSGAPGRGMQMGAAAFWKRVKRAAETDLKERKRLVAAWIAQLKKGLAAIAMAKSSQQFGREEEKE